LILGIRPRVLTSLGVTGVVGQGGRGSEVLAFLTSGSPDSWWLVSTFISLALGPASW